MPVRLEIAVWPRPLYRPSPFRYGRSGCGILLALLWSGSLPSRREMESGMWRRHSPDWGMPMSLVRCRFASVTGQSNIRKVQRGPRRRWRCGGAAMSPRPSARQSGDGPLQLKSWARLARVPCGLAAHCQANAPPSPCTAGGIGAAGVFVLFRIAWPAAFVFCRTSWTSGHRFYRVCSTVCMCASVRACIRACVYL